MDRVAQTNQFSPLKVFRLVPSYIEPYPYPELVLHMNTYKIAGYVIGITLLTVCTVLIQQVYAAIEDGAQITRKTSAGDPIGLRKAAPIATSDDNNVYIAWWSNKTGNDEVMFKASADGGKTFAGKMNLSNSPTSDSQDTQIAASGNNVYVTWWERNQTMNEPVLRVSNDNGKTFGEKTMLSEK